MKKIFVFTLFFHFLILIQTSFLVHFSIFGIIPNLILISVVVFNFFEKPRKNSGFLIAAIGGFYLDLFSNFQIGASVFSLVILVLLIKKFLKFVGEENIFYFILLFVFSLIFYDSILILFDSILKQSFSFSLIFSKSRAMEVIYNLTAGILVFYFAKICFLKALKK